ncbi:bifunctional serine/threonine protein kinase/MFS transporter [Thermomonospora cellulosilytica]|uniref:Putative Ser/Thr protein kinase n=1 Tax=Thermomonospora cellulosilytica TaxID=1411118 RepID=A0A7W3MWX5_9ACTN|nr:bifunctional serine/threonine protein kinase/MFS transporter [Thermomonospora cellulosilytica]MBA9003417.1 putative Ser/Thr protein kinase [Thermomonospora cellulosilytica]
MPEVTPLQPGDPSRLGDYPLAGRLGEGGQGVVYLGHGPDGERVAVKLLRARLDRGGKAYARFAREVAIAERVAPFCTARVITADLLGDTPYVVSEYVEGPSLQESVRSGGPLTGAALDRLAIFTATALAAIHEAGIVHRDFKPGNVLLAPDGPRVIDFGIARALDATSTITSQVIGTPAFMSPEQINGEEIGPPSDMFAWGGTIVYAATGAPPFGGDAFPAILNRILHHEPDLGALTGPLRHVVAAALSKDPGQRPTPRDVLDHMVAGRATPVIVGRPGTPPEPSAPPPPPGQVAAAGPPPTPGPIPAPAAPAMPPPSARPSAGQQLIGPVLGGLVGLYLLTVTTGSGWTEHARMDLALAASQIPWVSAAYPVAAALTVPVGTVLGRRWPNAVAAASAVLMAVGSLLGFLAVDYTLLLAGRIVSGLGAGALVAEAVGLALRAGPRRASAIGPAAGLGALAAALGLVLAATLPWRWAFLIPLPPLLLAVLVSIVSGITTVGSRPANR